MQTEENAQRALSLYERAAELYEQADYAAAGALYERSLAIQEAVNGTEHPDTARCLHGLGQVRMRQGEEHLARSLLEQALAIQEKTLGPEHPDTTASLHTLGELASNQGDSETGLELVGRAFIFRQLAFGLEHADTIDSMALMALILAQQGERETAIQTLNHALSVCEPALGEHHRTTARVLNGLGRLYAADEATYSRARSLYERALSIYEHLLGPDHPQTALVLNNLAAVLSDLQDPGAALPLLKRSLAVHERVYGPRDWRTSFVLVNLADLQSRQGEYTAARPLLERALIIRERVWGARHPQTVSCLRKLVATLGNLHQQGDEGAMLLSMALYPCLTSLEAADGKREPADALMPGAHLDPDKAARRLHRLLEKLAADLSQSPLSPAQQADLETARELARQADEFYAQGDHDSAVIRLEAALSLQEHVLGEHHLDHVALLKKLAHTRERQGRYSAVLPLTQRVADIHIQVLGPDHPATLLALSELMSRQAYEYGGAAARPVQEQILQSMQDTLGPDDPFVTLGRRAVDRLGAELDERTTGQGPSLTSRSQKREEALAARPAREEGPLAGLEEIDWHALHHGYGPADDVPNLLRLLLSGDEEVRESAWQELYGNLWHQGDVYQATQYAVPFLIRMLDAEQTPGKEEILCFLHAVATGHPWLSENHDWMEPVLANQGRDWRTEIEHAQDDADRAHEAAVAGLDTYLDLLTHPLPLVRQGAATLLCAFPERARRVLPAFVAQLEAEREVGVKAHLAQQLGLCVPLALPAGDRWPCAEALEGLTRPQEDRKLRFAAAVALARISGDETTPKTIEILEEAVAQPGGLHPSQEGQGDEPTFFADLVIEEVCAAVSHLSVERRIPILTRMLSQVTSPFQAHLLAVLLLDSALLGLGRRVSYSGTPDASEDQVFYGTVHPPAADGVEERIYPLAEEEIDVSALTPRQKQALQAVLDSTPVWSIRSNLLQLYGLPASLSGPRESRGSPPG